MKLTYRFTRHSQSRVGPVLSGCSYPEVTVAKKLSSGADCTAAMLDNLIQAAEDMVGTDDHVNKEALKSIYQLQWHNPNNKRRDAFRQKMKEKADEDQGYYGHALKYLCEIAEKIDVEIMSFSKVTPHLPRESGGEPWKKAEDKKTKAAKAKKKKEEEEEAARKKEKEKEKARTGGAGGTGGKSGGKGGTGEQEPPWEQGWLEKLEWDTPLLTEEGWSRMGSGWPYARGKPSLRRLTGGSAVESWR